MVEEASTDAIFVAPIEIAVPRSVGGVLWFETIVTFQTLGSESS